MNRKKSQIWVALGTVLLLALATPGKLGAQGSSEPSQEREVNAADDGQARGRQLVAKAVGAMGGAERIDAVKSLEQIGPIVLKMGQGEMVIKTRQLILYPDRMRLEVLTLLGEIVRVISPEGAMVKSPQGARPMPEDARQEFEKQMNRDLLMLLKARHDPEFQAVAVGTLEVDGEPVEQVSVQFRGTTSTLGIDPVSGRIRTLSHAGEHPKTRAQGEYLTVYSDFRDVNGVLFPFARSVSFEGESSSSLAAESVQIDGPIDEAAFAVTTTPTPTPS